MTGMAAGYVRVSTEKQKQNESHKDQRLVLERWADENDYELEVYEDIAESGQKEEREDYQRLMEEHEEYDLVVVRELSRFGRDLQRVLNDIETLAENDVDFVSLNESMIDTTSADGRVFLQIIGAFDEFWANLARERTEELYERKMENGEGWGRNRKIEPGTEGWRQVREWFEMGLSPGAVKNLVEGEVSGDLGDVDSISRKTLWSYRKELYLDEEAEV